LQFKLDHQFSVGAKFAKSGPVGWHTFSVDLSEKVLALVEEALK
jgi:hypothetical protein